MRCTLFLLLFFFSQFSAHSQEGSFSLAVLQYRGGGDWYANPTSVPNLAMFCRKELDMKIGETQFVEAGSPDIFDYPFVHMTGHGNVVFNKSDRDNIRTYLLAGGFLHIDDNYGMDPFIRIQLKEIFPDKDLIEIPFDHPIFHQKFDFSSGLPKVHEHDGLSPKGFGIFHQQRMILFYSYESDLGDGWEDATVHNDDPNTRLKALQMGANLVQYALIGEPDQ